MRLLTGALIPILLITACATPQPEKVLHFTSRKFRDSLSPERIIEILKEGNEDFQKGKHINWDYVHEARQSEKGQWPGAIVLSCIDSRAPTEILFDLGIGDIFSTRVAGNYVTADVAGGLEYACKVAGSKVILVLGHTHCGAVKSACDHVEMGNITEMLSHVMPAVDSVRDVPGERSSKNKAFLKAVGEANVHHSVKRIREVSPILADLEREGKVMIVGAMYDVGTGRVTFYE